MHLHHTALRFCTALMRLHHTALHSCTALMCTHCAGADASALQIRFELDEEHRLQLSMSQLHFSSGWKGATVDSISLQVNDHRGAHWLCAAPARRERECCSSCVSFVLCNVAVVLEVVVQCRSCCVTGVCCAVLQLGELRAFSLPNSELLVWLDGVQFTLPCDLHLGRTIFTALQHKKVSQPAAACALCSLLSALSAAPSHLSCHFISDISSVQLSTSLWPPLLFAPLLSSFL